MDHSTIRKLERRHVTNEGLAFERSKTGVRQIIEWNDELRGVVDAALRKEPRFRQALICNRHGKAYTADGFQTNWQRLIVRCVEEGRIAERFTFHDLRAKSASDAASDQEAAGRLGHGDPAITRRVYRRLPKGGQALKILDKPA